MTDCAVFFLPGILGTRLQFKSPSGIDGGVWDPDDSSGLSTAAAWSLKPVRDIRKVFSTFTGYPIGSAPYNSMSGWDHRPYGWSTVVRSKYFSLLDYLETELSAPVFAIGYDWTKDCRMSADYVALKIEEIADVMGIKGVALITHSMGGLVARSAFLRRSSFARLVTGVIHIAQPVSGATIAYRRCLTGSTGDGWGMDKIFGNEWWKYLAQIAVMPSVLELLPTNGFRPTAVSWPASLPIVISPPSTSHWLYDIYAPAVGLPVFRQIDPDIYAAYQGTVFPGICFDYQNGPDAEFSNSEWQDIIKELKANLRLARSFHRELHDASGNLFEIPTTAYVAGGDNPSTESGIVGITREFPAAVPFQKTIIVGTGDSTVPIDSAQALYAQEDGKHDTAPDSAGTGGKPASRMKLAPGVHSDICSNKTVQVFVKNFASYLLDKCDTADGTDSSDT